MAIQNPPLTDNPTLNFALLELVREVNNSEQRLLTLINQIKTSTDFADLQAKVNER
jgi:hypothetical protein